MAIIVQILRTCLLKVNHKSTDEVTKSQNDVARNKISAILDQP